MFCVVMMLMAQGLARDGNSYQGQFVCLGGEWAGLSQMPRSRSFVLVQIATSHRDSGQTTTDGVSGTASASDGQRVRCSNLSRVICQHNQQSKTTHSVSRSLDGRQQSWDISTSDARTEWPAILMRSRVVQAYANTSRVL